MLRSLGVPFAVEQPWPWKGDHNFDETPCGSPPQPKSGGVEVAPKGDDDPGRRDRGLSVDPTEEYVASEQPTVGAAEAV